MLAPITHILPLTTIQRERMLPLPGRVLARRGQKVNPGDVVAEAVVSPEHVLLDVSRGLDLRPEEADRYIKVQAGAQVDTGDVIAERGNVARRVVRCPKPGKVVVAGSGQVLLELETPPFELKAGMSGVVVELYPDRGVLVETTGALIQGVWGNGGIDFGLMNVLAKKPDHVLKADRLDVSLRGSVVLGGHCEDVEVIRLLDDLPLRGLILASMNAKLVSAALKVRCPIILLEGFGKLPMNPVAFKLLSTSDRREVSVNAARWEPLLGVRPEIVIALPAEASKQAEEITHFKPGQQVRVLRAPYRGAVGGLMAVLPGVTLLPNGLMTQVAEVRFEGNEKALIPLANLEVLG